MDIRLIRMFNRALKGNDVPYERIAELAMKAGYVIDPECATEDVLKFLREEKANLNSTFYKTWEDITSKTRFELFLDQIRHYASTYGTIDEPILNGSYMVAGDGTIDVHYNVDGNGYVPNSDPIFVEWKKFKVIKPATPAEIRDLILDMFKSGAAMKEDTINVCIEFLQENDFLKSINVDDIKNREAQTIISVKTKKFPSDEFGMLRAIMYTYTGKASVIKNKETIHTIKSENGFTPKAQFDFALLSDKQLTRLSRIFYRYKPLFIAMKGYGDNAKYVNKIRRLAEKNHTPLKKGFWENCFAIQGRKVPELLDEARKTVKDLNNFRKVQVMQSIMERLNGKNMDGKMYIIRNGKMFIRDGYHPETNQSYLMDLYGIVKNALIESLREKKATFKIPVGLHLACPTSEKNFLGNYPIGTRVDFEDGDNVIGIYWRNEWGTRDFDLHVMDEKGNHYGWNAAFRDENQQIIYSGDMTNADPEAVEMYYFKKGVPDGFVNLNKFNGNQVSKYKLFVAKENVVDKIKKAQKGNFYTARTKSYAEKIMVDPNNIIAEAMIDFNDFGQQTIAYLHNNSLYLMTLHSGDSRVTRKANNDIIQQANKVKADSYIDLIPILEEARFTRVTGNTEAIQEAKAEVKTVDTTGLSVDEAVAKVKAEYEKVDEANAKKEETVEVEYDFTNPSKELLLKLFA